jgi:hypothetical protein
LLKQISYAICHRSISSRIDLKSTPHIYLSVGGMVYWVYFHLLGIPLKDLQIATITLIVTAYIQPIVQWQSFFSTPLDIHHTNVRCHQWFPWLHGQNIPLDWGSLTMVWAKINIK